MHVIVAGGHGQVAMHLHPILRERGHMVSGLIRDPDQAGDLREAGAEPILCDMEQEEDLSPFIEGADAVVFAAGAGPGSGAERKWTVDRDAAVKLIEAARRQGIRRYVMISVMGADRPRGNEVFRTYLRAKAEADEALRSSGLDYTIIRPGRLTDDEPTGRVALGPELPSGEVTRADVAAVLARVLDTPETIGMALDLTGGETPVDEAVKQAV